LCSTSFFIFSEHFIITASAYTQARKHLSHTAFIALNEGGVVPLFYNDEHEKFKNHRLLAVDGSIVILPQSASSLEEFGSTTIANKDGSTGDYISGRASVLYDVLNKIAISSLLGEHKLIK